MKNIKLTLLTITLLSIGHLLYAQDPHFSQYYSNPLYLNPAFAGSNICPRASLNYRNQYPVLDVFQTYSASYDQYVDGLNGGIGVLVMRDNAGGGALTTTEASLIYSYHLKVSRKFTLLAGFQGTFRQRAVNWGQFTFPDQIDPYYGFVPESQQGRPASETSNNLDVSAGILGFTEKFYFGASFHHLTQPDEAFFQDGKLPLKIS